MYKLLKKVKKIFRQAIRYIVTHPNEFTTSERFFTRKRKLTLEKVIGTIFSFTNSTLSSSIYDYLVVNLKSQFATASAFIQQRKKIKLKVFEYIFNKIRDGLIELCRPKRFYGMFILACDGSDFPMPTEVVPSDPGASGYSKVQNVLIHVNALYDVLNHQYVGITMEPKLKCSERNELIVLAEKVAKDNSPYHPEECIILADRGYNGYHLLKVLSDMGYYFVFRITAENAETCADCCGKVLVLPTSEKDIAETEGTLQLRKKKSTGKYRRRFAKSADPERDADLDIRIIAHVLQSGEIQFLITNLPKDRIPVQKLAALYKKRWHIETSFKHTKYHTRGLVVHSKQEVYQVMEILASITLFNCVSFVIFHDPKTKNGLRDNRKINFHETAHICIQQILKVGEIAKDINAMIYANIVASRKGMICPRGKDWNEKRAVDLQYRF